MRSEFEKNVMHKQIIDRVRFSEKANQYLPVDASFCVDRSCADVVNVGWISYQYQQSKVDELQKRVDAALKITSDNLQYVSQNHRDIFKPLLMTMIRSFKELEQALKDGENE